jgi:membrane protein implicated in regulation of membrane protease activity
MIFAPAIATATLGVDPDEAGVASAAVNANQQLGGSVGVALLSTIAAGATSSFIAGGHPSAALLAAATVHGYTTAFAWSGGIFLLGAVVAALLFRPRRPVAAELGSTTEELLGADGPGAPDVQPTPAPVLAH